MSPDNVSDSKSVKDGNHRINHAQDECVTGDHGAWGSIKAGSTCRRADGVRGLQKFDLLLIRSQLVDGPADVAAELPLLDPLDPEDGVRELVSRGEHGDLVVLVVVDLVAVFEPEDGRGRKGFDVALQMKGFVIIFMLYWDENNRAAAAMREIRANKLK